MPSKFGGVAVDEPATSKFGGVPVDDEGPGVISRAASATGESLKGVGSGIVSLGKTAAKLIPFRSPETQAQGMAELGDVFAPGITNPTPYGPEHPARDLLNVIHSGIPVVGPGLAQLGADVEQQHWPELAGHVLGGWVLPGAAGVGLGKLGEMARGLKAPPGYNPYNPIATTQTGIGAVAPSAAAGGATGPSWFSLIKPSIGVLSPRAKHMVDLGEGVGKKLGVLPSEEAATTKPAPLPPVTWKGAGPNVSAVAKGNDFLHSGFPQTIEGFKQWQAAQASSPPPSITATVGLPKPPSGPTGSVEVPEGAPSRYGEVGAQYGSRIAKAAFEKDGKVAQYLKSKGITADKFRQATDAQRNGWAKEADPKFKGINPDRIEDVAKLLE